MSFATAFAEHAKRFSAELNWERSRNIAIIFAMFQRVGFDVRRLSEVEQEAYGTLQLQNDVIEEKLVDLARQEATYLAREKAAVASAREQKHQARQEILKQKAKNVAAPAILTRSKSAPLHRYVFDPPSLGSSLAGADPPWLWTWAPCVPFSEMDTSSFGDSQQFGRRGSRR